MNETKTEPGLFEGTAWYYSRFRFGYPSEAIDAVVRRFCLSESTFVLDLGCGTGQIALPIAQRGIPVYAIDPEVEMLAEGVRAEKSADASGVFWMRGDDKTLGQLHLPPLTVCTLGASFHWMDRDRVLLTLDGMIATNGGVVVLGSGSVWSTQGTGQGPGTKARSWTDVAKEVIVEFLGPERRAGTGVYNHPVDRHEVVLARSPFSNVEKLIFASSRTVTVDDLVGLQLSTSYASPAQLRDRLSAFKSALTDRLLNFEPSGLFHCQETTEVLIAARPGPGSSSIEGKK